MADAADPKLIEEMLRQRGLLATGGNIRMLPFDNASGAATATTPSDSTGSATAGALAANGGGGVTVKDNTGNPVTIPVNATTLPDNVPDDSFISILPALAGAGGAALALLIKNHLAKKGVVPPETDTLAPLSPEAAAAQNSDGIRAGDGIIDGEFTEVNDPRLEGSQKRLPGQQKLLPAPPPTLEDTNAAGAPKHLTADALRARKIAGRKAGVVGSEGSGPTLVGNDSYADLSPDEMKQARSIADSLIQRRMAGRTRRYAQGKSGVGRDHLPTAPIDKEGAFNIVVRAIRDAKLNPNAVRRAVAH